MFAAQSRRYAQGERGGGGGGGFGGGGGGFGLEPRQHPIAKGLQQIPVVQLVFSNRHAFGGHALSKPEVAKFVQLQSRANHVTIETRPAQIHAPSQPAALGWPKHKACRTQLVIYRNFTSPP